MPALGSLAIQTVTDYALDFHVRGGMLLQTMQQRPLLRYLEGSKKTFPGGKAAVTEPVKGAVMNDTAGFFAGVTNNSVLAFTQTAQGVRASYNWKMAHAGLVIEHLQLLQDGISVVDGETKTSEHTDVALTRLTGILSDALEDFSESWARAKNLMLWRDGSQDANLTPGVKAILVDDPTIGTVGGLSQATYTWWRSRVKLDLVASAENQTISKFFRNEVKQLRRYGGKPNKALCGSLFWDALMTEVSAKGIYTQSGFAKKTNDFGMTVIAVDGIGEFEYDPTLDDLGESKRCYVFDPGLKLRPIEGESNKTLNPARPYNYLVLLKSMTDTSALTANRLNGMGVYGIA